MRRPVLSPVPRAPRLLLHAAFLGFFHPSTATELRVESGAPF
jgi:23S rRNA-/tRNA-specific pseudouridylate synthase